MYNFFTPANVPDAPPAVFNRQLLEYMLSIQKVEIQPLVAESPIANQQKMTWQAGPSWLLEADWEGTLRQQPAVDLLHKCSALQTPPTLGCLLIRETAADQSLLIRSFAYYWQLAEKTQSWEWLNLLARLHGAELWGVLISVQ